jgi:hypothetical protein
VDLTESQIGRECVLTAVCPITSLRLKVLFYFN